MSGGKITATNVTTEENRRKAMDLRRRGKSYQQIADALGCSRPYAFRLVTDALAECVAERKEDAKHVVEMELQRIDEMVAALLPAATVDVPVGCSDETSTQLGVIDRVVRLMERRAKLLGLDVNRTEISGPDGAPVTVDVVNGLRAKLARLADEGAAGDAPSEPDAG